jgi:glutathione S-transferase
MSNDDVELFQYPGTGTLPSLSPPCLKVQLALRRLGVPHVVTDVSPVKVKRVSPSGRLPALRIDGRIVVDSPTILDVLEKRHPDSDLWPRDPQQRIVDRLWDHFVTDTLYWGGVYQRYLIRENREAAWDLFFGKGFSFKRLIVAPFIVREVRNRTRGQGIGRLAADDVRRSYGNWIAMIDEALQPGPFLQGRDVPGRGDLSVVSHVAQMVAAPRSPELASAFERFPRLELHVARVFAACGLPPLEPART